MSGGAAGTGHAFVLLDAKKGSAALTGSAGAWRDFARMIDSTPRTDEDTPIRLPGQRELAHMRRHRAEGIALDRDTLSQVRALADGRG